MDSHIIVNKKIYEAYKDEIITLNPRLFTASYFYNLKEYTIPLDLKGIENFLNYIETVYIYTSSTFIDFVNILLVLSFLKNKSYTGKVNITYFSLNKNNLREAKLVNICLTNTDYNDTEHILLSLVNERKINNTSLKLPGIINFINFYNMIIDGDKFILSLDEIIEEYEENIDLIANYLYEKYSNMGLNKEFYIKFLNKYL